MSERGGDHGFLSDCTSAALVARDGTVDWWCLPRFDGPSVFGGLLGPEAGSWSPQAFSHVGLINAAWRLAHPEPVTPVGSLGR